MQLLKKIIQSPEHYARFLNTLSMLEYIGARKIMKSQAQQHLTAKLLAHISEEMRHALILKRAALKILPVCTSYAPQLLLCGSQASHYFQTIDHAPNDELGETNAWHCYIYTTLLIEMRALDFYATFDQALQELEQPRVFRGILAEEQQHLQEVRDWLSHIPHHEENLQRLQKIEQQQFVIFLTAVEESISGDVS